MAKTTFAKLGLKLSDEVKQIKCHEETIEVKQYLSVEDLIRMSETIINFTVDDNNRYFNGCKLEIYKYIVLIENYTNISFTEKQKNNIYKLYDSFKATIGDEIINLIPSAQKELVDKMTYDTLNSFYAYKNSIFGVLEDITADYSGLEFEAKNLKDLLDDKENLKLVKDIVSKLG